MLIGLEACGDAHDWARRYRAYGHEGKLRAPQCVKPYVKSNKNDCRAAEAIAAAVTRPPRRFVPIKHLDQQDIEALHRVRERLISARTALVHEVHGLMNESGLVLPQGVSQFRQAVVRKLESAQDKLSTLSQEMFWQLVEAFAALEEPRASDQEQLAALATTPPAWQRLRTMPGIGPCSAMALVAAVSDASACKNARHCAAWLGLVPCPYATGGKERLLGMRKRGESSLRKLLIHGARATLRWVGLKTDRRSQWIRQRSERRGKNCTAVVVANKDARIVWALLTSHQVYAPAMSSSQRRSG